MEVSEGLTHCPFPTWAGLLKTALCQEELRLSCWGAGRGERLVPPCTWAQWNLRQGGLRTGDSAGSATQGLEHRGDPRVRDVILHLARIPVCARPLGAARCRPPGQGECHLSGHRCPHRCLLSVPRPGAADGCFHKGRRVCFPGLWW